MSKTKLSQVHANLTNLINGENVAVYGSKYDNVDAFILGIIHASKSIQGQRNQPVRKELFSTSGELLLKVTDIGFSSAINDAVEV